MNSKGYISLYFYNMGYWDARYGSHTRDKNSIRNFWKSKAENPARCYVIHKCFRSYLKIPLKGNHILKFNILIIDISCSLNSEISREFICWLFARFKAYPTMDYWLEQLPIIYLTLIDRN